MNEKQAMIAGVVAGIGASLCCVAPLLLVSLGLGGAWLANLTVLEPIRPIFIVLTLAFVGLAFHKLYVTPKACKPGMVCADAKTLNKQRVIYWVVTIPLLGLLVFPWFAPLFY
jgi:mercuric ion transport protein